jgi:hypothetical protein
MAKFIFISYQIHKIRDSFKKRNRFIFIGFGLCLLLNLVNWGFLYLKFPLVKGLSIIPLHYNIYFGIDLIGLPLRIFILPLFGFLVGLLNFVLSYIFYIKEKLLSYFFVISTILIEIFLIIASFFVILINL